MTWLKKNLLFSIAMAVLAGVLIVEIVLILRERGHALELKAEYEAKVNEHHRLVTQDTLPHERNVELTAVEIERKLEELGIYEESMDGREGLAEAFAAHPTTGPDALFDIASFVSEYRERAIEAGISPIEIENTHFGFEEYATVGPEESQLASVYKQRLVVAYILDHLIESGPQSILEVRRPGIITQPASEEESQQTMRSSRASASEPVVGGAEFSLSPELSAAIPGVVETTAYQVTFTGRTSTLRSFLNGLTSFEMPLIVRNIEVAPMNEATERRSPAARRTNRRRQVVQPEQVAPTPGVPGAAELPGTTETAVPQPTLVPVIADNLSRFTVAMEFVDIVHPDAESGTE